MKFEGIVPLTEQLMNGKVKLLSNVIAHKPTAVLVETQAHGIFNVNAVSETDLSVDDDVIITAVHETSTRLPFGRSEMTRYVDIQRLSDYDDI
jgi:hypothetical protein